MEAKKNVELMKKTGKSSTLDEASENAGMDPFVEKYSMRVKALSPREVTSLIKLMIIKRALENYGNDNDTEDTGAGKLNSKKKS